MTSWADQYAEVHDTSPFKQNVVRNTPKEQAQINKNAEDSWRAVSWADAQAEDTPSDDSGGGWLWRFLTGRW